MYAALAEGAAVKGYQRNLRKNMLRRCTELCAACRVSPLIPKQACKIGVVVSAR
jgi:hypothetical protein